MARSRSSIPLNLLTFGIKDPILFIIIGLLIGALLFFFIELLPKMLARREKYDRQVLGSDSSHDLASPPGAEAYFDPVYSVQYFDVVKQKQAPMLLLRNEKDLKRDQLTSLRG